MKRVYRTVTGIAGASVALALAVPASSTAAATSSPWHAVRLPVQAAPAARAVSVTPTSVAAPTARPAAVRARSAQPHIVATTRSGPWVRTLAEVGGISSTTDTTTPPNPSIAVSPNDVVFFTNHTMQVMSRSGVPLAAPVNLGDTFIHPDGGDSVANPHFVWDPGSRRFFGTVATYTGGGGTKITLMVSKTSNPLGAWWVYGNGGASPTGYVADDPTDILDNPQIVVTTDRVAVVWQVFTGGSTYAGPVVWTNLKAEPVAGATLGAPQEATLGTAYTGLFPVTNGSAREPAYFAWTSGSSVRLLSVSSDPYGEPVYQTAGASLGYPVASAPNATSHGGTLRIPSNWVYSAMVTGTNMWLGMTEGCVPPGDTATHDCLRLMHLDPRTMQLLEDRSLSTQGDDWFMPSVAVTSGGDVITTFSWTNSLIPLWIGQTGKRPADTAFQAPDIVASSGDDWKGTGSPMRYGNYPATALDPRSPTDVWSVGTYTNGTSTPNWVTFGLRESFVASTVTVKAAPANIVYGGTTKVTTTLTRPSGEPLASALVYLMQTPHGGSFTEATHGYTDAAGRLVVSGLAPTVNEDYRAQEWSQAPSLISAQKTITVGVAPAITRIVAPGITKPLGTTFTFTGKVSPNHSGQKILLQRYSGGAWQAVSGVSATLSGTSTYTLHWKPAAKGTFKLRVHTNADTDHIAGNSAPVTLTVT